MGHLHITEVAPWRFRGRSVVVPWAARMCERPPERIVGTMNSFYASDILVRQHHARLRADADNQRLVRAARRTRTRRAGTAFSHTFRAARCAK